MTKSSANNRQSKGFSGLNSMASDISEGTRSVKCDAIESSEPSKDNTEFVFSSVEQSKPTKVNPNTASSSYCTKNIVKWVVGLAIVFFLALGRLYEQKPTPKSKSTSPAKQSSIYFESQPSANYPQLPSTVSQLKLETPPVGSSHVLNINQIRYCQTEKIRIEAIKTIVNDNNHTEIVRFNNLVDDYNSRCGKYKYMNDDLQTVKRELELKISTIANQAKSEWRLLKK